MTMQDMLALGAPELPGDMYYHVYSNSWGYIFVSIRKSRKHFGHKTIYEVMGTYDVKNDEGEWVKLSPQETVKRAAEAAHKAVFKIKPAQRTWWDEFRTLEGDHK
jgi:hypothetical protein